jgi:hypothetical protein
MDENNNKKTSVPDASLTVAEFCAAEKICRTRLYQDWKQGTGPRFFYNGTRRRISAEARKEWRRQREQDAPNEIAVKTEARRRRLQQK